MVPKWFSDAVSVTPKVGSVEVDGCAISFRRWGQRRKPGLVLLHGGAAHARWWDFIAPQLMPSFDVVAVDLAGHGDSGWRPEYTLERWARDVLAVIEYAAFPSAPFVVGHSLGGMVTITMASLAGEKLAGGVVVDSMINHNPDEPPRRTLPHTHRTYPTLEAAMARFRLIPEQPSEHAFIIEYIARHSLKQVAEGWTWKFDPRVFLNLTLEQLKAHIKTVKCRMGVMRGETSAVLSREMGNELYELFERRAPLIEIPQSHHHLVLDQPVAFISATRALLADWQHSTPHSSP